MTNLSDLRYVTPLTPEEAVPETDMVPVYHPAGGVSVNRSISLASLATALGTGGAPPTTVTASPNQIAYAGPDGVFKGSANLQFVDDWTIRLGARLGEHVNITPNGLNFFKDQTDTTHTAITLTFLSAIIRAGDGQYDSLDIREDLFSVMLPVVLNTPTVKLPQLPASAVGLESGTLWNNAGVVNVAP